jgi:hypothetical protein
MNPFAQCGQFIDGHRFPFTLHDAPPTIMRCNESLLYRGEHGKASRRLKLPGRRHAAACAESARLHSWQRSCPLSDTTSAIDAICTAIDHSGAGQ